jgi:hypothetical protein
MNRITLLQLAIKRDKLDNPLLHIFRVLQSFLNFAEILLVIEFAGVG